MPNYEKIKNIQKMREPLKDWNQLERICPECASKMEKYSSCISGEYYKCPKCGGVDA